ncbi:MAG: o-succinylbenzoate--CoA ligase [Polyangiaceae bacterium]
MSAHPPSARRAPDGAEGRLHAPAPMDALSLFSPMDAEESRRLALVAPGAAWTFGEMSELARALAARLEDRGVTRGSRVALRAAASPEVLLTIATLAAVGATIVPIHPRLSPAEARVLVDVTRPDAVLDDTDQLLPSPSEVQDWRAAVTPVPVSTRSAAEESAPPFAIVTTSGTSGRPKGAVLSRRAMIASAEASAQNLGWEPGDRWLLCMPLAHVGGLSIVTRCLHARRTIVMLPRFEPRAVLDTIRRHDVTLLSVVPTMLDALFEADTDGVLARPRAILLGGAAAPKPLLEECARRGVRALTTYGLTEACSQVTCQSPREPSPREGAIRAGSGAPLAGVEVRIASTTTEDTAPVPANVTGRILIRGDVLFDGYLRAGGEVDPARVGDGWFETGDLGELDETGHLRVLVRRTDLIVTGGENVYPAEVEQALERLPGVRRAAVFGVPDARWGQIVAAAIVADPGTSTHKLTDLLSTTLAPYKRPRRWAVVEELPLTSSGKVQRGALAERFGPQLRPAS